MVTNSPDVLQMLVFTLPLSFEPLSFLGVFGLFGTSEGKGSHPSEIGSLAR